jgi:hypothetical protein
MAWGFTAVAAATVVGAAIQSDAASKAARSQGNAARDANATQLAIYNQQRADNEPFRQAGIGALDELKNNTFMNNWQQDPGYQFRMQEGQKALEAAAAARGLNNSGSTLKALTRYGQDYSTGEYNNIYNRNMSRINSLLGLGSSANAQNNQNSTNYGNNVSSNQIAAGNAQAAGQIAQGNAWGGALQNGANLWMNYNMMNKLFANGGSPKVNYNMGNYSIPSSSTFTMPTGQYGQY